MAIALPFQSSLSTLVVQGWQRNLPNSVMNVQSFCFAYFHLFVIVVTAVLSSLASSITMQWISSKKPTI